jgi:hypothetical protein
MYIPYANDSSAVSDAVSSIGRRHRLDLSKFGDVGVPANISLQVLGCSIEVGTGTVGISLVDNLEQPDQLNITSSISIDGWTPDVALSNRSAET